MFTVDFVHPSISFSSLQVLEPAVNKPTDAEFYIRDNFGDMKPNGAFLKQHFFREGRLTETQALFILDRATKVLTDEPNMVDVESPVTSELRCFSRDHSMGVDLYCFLAVCGDIHGQYVSMDQHPTHPKFS